jgi:aldose 1-epimerase
MLLAIGPATQAKSLGQVTSEFYGTTAGGQDVYEYTLTNAGKRPVEVKIITFGGIITSIVMPDKSGKRENVALGFDNLQDYETKNPYFGTITGRYANRIANGRFVLDGVTYCLDINNPPNSLHGGFVGFDKKVWEVAKAEAGADGVVLELHYLSLAGEGFEDADCPDGE